MKKTIILLFALLAQLGFARNSDNLLEKPAYGNTINIHVDSGRIEEVLRLIEKQVAVKFIYVTSDPLVEHPITLNINNATLDNVLQTLSKKTGLRFKKTPSGILVRSTLSPQKFSPLQQTLQGNVRDEEGEPLAGVSIVIKGTSNGTMTDWEGNFTLEVTDLPLELQISHIGYESQAITVGNDLRIQVTMKASLSELDEVVVTGQGAGINKKRISSKVEVIRAEELENIPSQRIDQLLSAKLPNAQINLTGGQAGASSLIRVRGVNSAFLSSTPIFYIDGVRMDNLNTRSALGGGSSQGAAISSIADIPMDNIERIEYINGGAATTLYGSDAANGVIQIFTKKGSAAGTKVTLEVQSGVETPTTDYLYFDKSKDLLFQTGLYQKYHLGINGGNEGFGFSFSGNYLDNEGSQYADNNSNGKLDFSTGFRARLGDKVIYNSSFIFVNNKYKRNRNGNQGGYTGLWFAESGASTLNGFNNRLDEMTAAEFEEIKAYVHRAEELQDNEINVNRFTTSQAFTFRPIDNLEFKFTGGIDYRVQSDQNVQTNEYLSHTTQSEVNDEGSISNVDRKYFGITLEFTGQHKWDTGDFSFVSTIGGQLFRNKDHQIRYVGTNIRDGARTISDAAIKTSDEFLTEVLNYGVYAQENIGYRDKLFLDLGIRGDRNPSFGDNIGTQYYPKIGLSYLPSAESFLENVDWLNSLRFRGNYGVAGNLPPAFVSERTIAFNGFQGEQAAFFSNPGNDDLTPEKTTTYEGGVDVAMFNNRVNLSVSRYSAKTKDALFYVPPTPSTGFDQSQLYNVGEIENKGWEISANVEPIRTDKSSLQLNLSINTLKNKVLNSGGIAPFNINGFSARTIQTVVEEGYPVGYIRGNLGVFDENGVLESTTPQSYLGTTLPDLYGNMGLTFTYGDFSLYANASYQKGAYANSFDQQFRFLYGASEDKIPTAEIEANGTSNWLNFTNRFVEKTDFIKVRDIGMNYTITPRSSKVFDNLIIGANIVNPLNFTSSDFDPEATISGAATGQGGASTGGISYATYSAPRQFLTSLRINFK
ncbi:TonB-dependent receptor [Muricauda oceani]|uniref:TonB-dependent receptor n=1 Tax=Flagellimonas oceani TaxID=2698672 RepID=A0A6G7J0C3_9FLAO|nr:TonB-dependent receptor [Allomuricauda oceani]MBW8244250.1 TonB-dependent receptor [Allomuricauda oceani]QII44100.1 TonB-dependent receptor [Allomuricauda oceani]